MNCLIDPETLTCEICGSKVSKPSVKKTCKIKPSVKDAKGPGTELKKLLSRFWFFERQGCSCNDRVILMNNRENACPGWCASHIDLIAQWMKIEAFRRRLPFSETVAKMLIRRAIRNAEINS